MLIKTLFKESDHGSYRAEIHKKDETNFFVDYYSPSGKIKTENFSNSNVSLIENLASSWLNGIKVLNG